MIFVRALVVDGFGYLRDGVMEGGGKSFDFLFV